MHFLCAIKLRSSFQTFDRLRNKFYRISGFLGASTNWPLLFPFSAFPSALQTIALLYAPESSWFLILRKKEKEKETLLKFLGKYKKNEGTWECLELVYEGNLIKILSFYIYLSLKVYISFQFNTRANIVEMELYSISDFNDMQIYTLTAIQIIHYKRWSCSKKHIW